MGEFRFDEKGNVRYEASNLADAAIMFSGDWDGALAQLPEANDTDAAIRAGTFLITPTQRLLEQPVSDAERLDAASRGLGEAIAQGIVDGRNAALADGGTPPPPDDTDEDTEPWDDGEEEDEGRAERIGRLLGEAFVYCALGYLLVRVIEWGIRDVC